MTVASEIAKGAKKGRVVGVVATLLIATLSGHNANAASVTTGSFTTTTNTDCYTSPSSGDGYGFNCPSVRFSFNDTFATASYVDDKIAQAVQASNSANTTAINDQASDINALKQNDIDLQNQIDGLQSNKADKSYVDSQNAAQNSAITANTNKNTQQDTAISNLQATDSSLQNQITANKNTADQQNSTQAQQITDLQNNKADKSALTALQ